MKKLTLISSLLCSAFVFGCGDEGPKATSDTSSTTNNTTNTTDSDSTTGSTTDTTGTSPTSTTASTPGTATEAGSSGGTDGLFIMMTDMTDGGCDVWTQDCPSGKKCVPASLDGDNSWESQTCVDVDPNPGAVGDPCTAQGISGVDTCEAGSICWNVSADTGMGTCIEQCKGTQMAPTCSDPGTTCVIAYDGVLTICLPNCDPLAQDCPNMDLCIANPQGSEGFACVLDASGDEGQAWDVCGYANECDAGNFCNDPALAPDYCDASGDGCCIPFCDLSAPDCPPPQMGMPTQVVECLAYYDPMTAPPGLENLGYCGVPM